MTQLDGALGFLVFIATCLGLAFIFTGEPDLWDVWHAQAMGKCVAEERSPTKSDPK